MAENPLRLADEMPRERFADCKQLIETEPVQDIERFLNFLKNFDNISELIVINHMTIWRLPPSEPDFLFKLENFNLFCSKFFFHL